MYNIKSNNAMLALQVFSDDRDLYFNLNYSAELRSNKFSNMDILIEDKNDFHPIRSLKNHGQASIWTQLLAIAFLCTLYNTQDGCNQYSICLILCNLQHTAHIGVSE